MADDLSEQIKQLLSELAGVPIGRLEPRTRIEEDLGMTGGDAAEMLEELAKRFDVDVTGIEFHKHFGPEGCNPFWLLYTPVWLKDHGKYPVTVDHLIRVAEVKRWFSPPRVG